MLKKFIRLKGIIRDRNLDLYEEMKCPEDEGTIKSMMLKTKYILLFLFITLKGNYSSHKSPDYVYVQIVIFNITVYKTYLYKNIKNIHV